MLYWSAAIFVIALLAALLGFGGLAQGAVDISKLLFILFLVFFVVSFLVELISRGRNRGR